jgi:hypothetical protein
MEVKFANQYGYSDVNPSKGKFYLADQPRKFIDYNF